MSATLVPASSWPNADQPRARVVFDHEDHARVQRGVQHQPRRGRAAVGRGAITRRQRTVAVEIEGGEAGQATQAVHQVDAALRRDGRRPARAMDAGPRRQRFGGDGAWSEERAGDGADGDDVSFREAWFPWSCDDRQGNARAARASTPRDLPLTAAWRTSAADARARAVAARIGRGTLPRHNIVAGDNRIEGADGRPRRARGPQSCAARAESATRLCPDGRADTTPAAEFRAESGPLGAAARRLHPTAGGGDRHRQPTLMGTATRTTPPRPTSRAGARARGSRRCRRSTRCSTRRGTSRTRSRGSSSSSTSGTASTRACSGCSTTRAGSSRWRSESASAARGREQGRYQVGEGVTGRVVAPAGPWSFRRSATSRST